MLDSHEKTIIAFQHTTCVEFRQALDYDNLLRWKRYVHFFTWTRMEVSTFVQSKLDRALCSKSCLRFWEFNSCTAFEKHHSDDCSLLFFLDSKVASKPKPFYFKDMWILDYGFIPLVGRIWRTSIIKNVVVTVIGKLRLVKATLRSWNVEMFRNMHNAIKVAKDKLGFGLNSY